METTPSLACANKCVFCWRHHTNPVGTEWKWAMDSPEVIFKGVTESHYQMVKQFKGVPGVVAEKLKDAFTIKHCALSLVGEPIMYPEINKLVGMLHAANVSTFLVTNAQFPDAIRNLVPVTQLYVSVDASTKDSLKKIDRPLFKDFWERFIHSLEALSAKGDFLILISMMFSSTQLAVSGQRTVYRLTLVKGFNVEEIKQYADRFSLGKPDFVEVKGVTYCGTTKNSGKAPLSMSNVPFHEEVISFCQQLADLCADYEIASEHEHSNCVLIAHKKFKRAGLWHTWIDYDKFHQLNSEFVRSGRPSFSSVDYMQPTPEWALFGCKERGFDPCETRWFRNKNNKV